MKKWILIGLATVVGASVAYGHAGSPSPTVWGDGQILTATSLNDTVAHIHNTLSGGIVDSHISATASIQHSKLQAPTLVPKAFSVTRAACTASPCTRDSSAQVTTIARAGVGLYDVTLGYAPANVDFGVIVSPSGVTATCFSSLHSVSAPHFRITCSADTGPTFIVLDND